MNIITIIVITIIPHIDAQENLKDIIPFVGFSPVQVANHVFNCSDPPQICIQNFVRNASMTAIAFRHTKDTCGLISLVLFGRVILHKESDVTTYVRGLFAIFQTCELRELFSRITLSRMTFVFDIF